MKIALLQIQDMFFGIGITDKGLALLTLPYNCKQDTTAALEAELNRIKKKDKNFAYNEVELENSLLKRIADSLTKYFKGNVVDFSDIPLDLAPHGLTNFQDTILREIITISYGKICTYKWLAEAINNSKAVRAVGQAVGRNPIPIIIPCHRIVGSDGSLTGFSGGLDKKKFLLNLEGINADDSLAKINVIS
ncbi:MAG: methylated-DNA--[protein]-cysteine S-methyltransferase [Bacillota bacterium]|nr:methylated-DNA--[protein]-cysteine S-methyltransferase [Bacillota bacterium]